MECIQKIIRFFFSPRMKLQRVALVHILRKGRQNIMKKLALFIIGVLLSVGFLALAGQLAIAQDEAVTTPSMGDEIEVDGRVVVIQGARYASSLTDNTGTGSYSALPGDKFLLVEVTILNPNPGEEMTVGTDDFASIVTYGSGTPAPKVGSGSSNYCLTAGANFCGGSTRTSGNLSQDWVYIVLENSGPEFSLSFEGDTVQPIQITTAPVTPTSLPQFETLITVNNIQEVTSMATFFNYHENRISQLSLSADDRVVASSSWTATKLWDIEANEELAILDGDGAVFSPVAPSLLAFKSFDNEIRLHSVDTGDTTTLGEFAERLYTVSWSSDGKVLAASGCDDLQGWSNCIDASIHLYNMVDQSLIVELDGQSPALSPDGSLLAYKRSVVDSEELVVYTIANQEELTIPVEESVTQLRFNSDSGNLAVATESTITVFNTMGEELLMVDQFEKVQSMVFSENQFVVSGCELQESRWACAEDAARLLVFDGNLEQVQTIQTANPLSGLSFMDETLIAFSFGQIQFWNLGDEAIINQVAISSNAVFAENFIVASNGRQMRLYSIKK